MFGCAFLSLFDVVTSSAVCLYVLLLVCIRESNMLHTQLMTHATYLCTDRQTQHAHMSPHTHTQTQHTHTHAHTNIHMHTHTPSFLDTPCPSRTLGMIYVGERALGGGYRLMAVSPFSLVLHNILPVGLLSQVSVENVNPPQLCSTWS